MSKNAFIIPDKMSIFNPLNNVKRYTKKSELEVHLFVSWPNLKYFLN